MIVLESDREWDIIYFGFMHFKQQTSQRKRFSPFTSIHQIHSSTHFHISGSSSQELLVPASSPRKIKFIFHHILEDCQFENDIYFFKSGMFYCISFRSIIDWDQTRFQLSNISPKVSRFKTFCKQYQITGTSQNNQAFKTPWRVQHILRGWDLPAESLTFDWKLAGARFSSQYFPITSTSWESGDFSVLTSMPSHSFSIFCDQTNMCERLITVVIHLMLNNNINQRTP